jgi:branched-chain amino acid transport system substrate-binding protein
VSDYVAARALADYSLKGLNRRKSIIFFNSQSGYSQSLKAKLGGNDVYAPKTLEVGGAQAAGMIVAVPWHIDTDPAAAFPQQSRQFWGAEVNWRTALAYDATQALAASISQNPTRKGMQTALSQPGFNANGASGTIRFLASGDRNATIQLVKVVAGNKSGCGWDFVPVKSK